MTDLVWHLFDDDGGFYEDWTADPVIEDEADPDDSCSRPKCRACGGPNFSLKKDICICCRII